MCREQLALQQLAAPAGSPPLELERPPCGWSLVQALLQVEEEGGAGVLEELRGSVAGKQAGPPPQRQLCFWGIGGAWNPSGVEMPDRRARGRC